MDLGQFEKNSSINIDEAVKTITTGDGYVILKGLFNNKDIQHARETIMYLISKQGKKQLTFRYVHKLSAFISCNYRSDH